jgi:predicted Zn-dependent protease
MRKSLLIFLSCAVLALAGCRDAESEAESFFRSGLELREEGDLDRAALEFRNVFRFDGAHKEARRNLAEIELEQGDVQEAYSQYLRLAEQYPDDPDIRVALFDIAIGLQAVSEMRRHGPIAVALAPERPEVRAIAAVLDYIDASEGGEDGTGDPEARADALARAEMLLAADPELDTARRLLIVGRLDAVELESALEVIEEALARAPGDLELSRVKLQTLNALDRPEEVEALLLDMYARFPDEDVVARDLVAWYASRGDDEAVERLLRDRADAPDAGRGDVLALVRFLGQSGGFDAARAELGARLATEEDPALADLYARTDAALAFDSGARDEAVEILRARLEDEVSSSETNEIRTTLAQMLMVTGNVVGARALVEEALAADQTNVAALKMQAGWLIESDRPDEAIEALRTALDQAPRDASIATLMASAYQRAGNQDLAGERMALAVELSRNGVPETIRYAQFLVDRGRIPAARALLAESAAANPGNVDLLTQQARFALNREDLGAARAAIAALEAIEDDPVAADRAGALRAVLLLGEERFDEGIALLEQRAQEDESSARVLDVVRTRLRAGQVEEARAYLRERLRERPEDPTLRFADAVLDLAEGQVDTAEASLRDLVEEFPTVATPVRQLYGLLRAEGRNEEAAVVMDAALERMPGSRELLLTRAASLERAADLEGALAVYEILYEANTGDLIAANNYASLLSDLRDDSESLERARSVARRLGDTQIPAFQDTYGWIAYRLGDYGLALSYLEPAARGLPDNPIVLYHLGMTYVALEMTDRARETLGRAVELGEGTALPQVERAREALAAL